MGSATSAHHEWIELYNDGAATVLDGWVLSDGKNLSIELVGTLPANSYAVLERTSDETAPGPAFFIYTGALGNTGATLRLEDAQGQLADLVAGGENWQNIGGDNTTKETAQYSAKGWITAAATPGQQNSTEASVTDSVTPAASEPNQSESRKQSTKSSVQTVPLTLPDVTLQLDIAAQTVGYVNQAIAFDVTATGIGRDLLNSLAYRWNFGDGTVGQTAEVAHQFAYPGTYVVTLHAEYKRQKQLARHEITILPVEVSLTQNGQGDIQVNNDSPYEIDISGYTLKAKDAFTFPPYSLLLPNQSITIKRQRVADDVPVMAALYDTEKIQLATILPEVLRPTQSSQLARAPQTSVQTAPAVISRQPVVSTPAPVVVQKEVVQPVITDVQPESRMSGPSQSATVLHAATQKERLSYVGLAIIILLGILGVYLTPRRNKTDSSDFA